MSDPSPGNLFPTPRLCSVDITRPIFVRNLLLVCGCFLGHLTAQGQLVYVNDWSLDGPLVVGDIVRMENGDLIVAGELSGALLLWRFTENGDSLWSQQQGAGGYVQRMVPLPGDRFFISTAAGSGMLDGYGGVLFTQMVSMDACVAPGGRLMLAHRTETSGSFRLIDTLGATIASNQFALPQPGSIDLLVTHIGNGNFIVMADQSHYDCTGFRSELLLELDSTGQLVDSLSLQADCGAFNANVLLGDLITLNDGGFLGLAMHGSCGTTVVRGDMEGDTLWTRHYACCENDVLGFECFHGTDCLELPSGNLLLSGGGAIPLEGFPEALFVETDPDGEPLCAASFTIDPTFVTQLSSVVVLPGDELAFCGSMMDLFTGLDPRLLMGKAQDPCLITTGSASRANPFTSIFPNPTDGPLLLGLSDRLKWPVSYTITDDSGALCQRGMLKPDGALDASALNAGAYIVRLIDREGSNIAAPFIRH